MYSSQVESKNDKSWFGQLKKQLRAEELLEEVDQKHFKTEYACKPTKRYLRITRKVEKLGF